MPLNAAPGISESMSTVIEDFYKAIGNYTNTEVDKAVHIEEIAKNKFVNSSPKKSFTHKQMHRLFKSVVLVVT